MNTYEKMLADIRKHGHHKGDFYADKNDPWNSAACLVGSMHRVSGTVMARYRYTPKAAGLLNDIIFEQFPDRLKESPTEACIIPNFNDHEDTTLPDIILVLEKAAIQENEKV